MDSLTRQWNGLDSSILELRRKRRVKKERLTWEMAKG